MNSKRSFLILKNPRNNFRFLTLLKKFELIFTILISANNEFADIFIAWKENSSKYTHFWRRHDVIQTVLQQAQVSLLRQNSTWSILWFTTFVGFCLIFGFLWVCHVGNFDLCFIYWKLWIFRFAAVFLQLYCKCCAITKIAERETTCCLE